MRVLRIRGGLLLALSIRDFRLLWTAELLSGLGSWLLLIAVPYKVFELTASPTATGFAFVAESVPAMVIGPIAGVAVDRWDHRRTMIAVSLGQGGCILPVAFVHQPGQVAIVYLALLAESALGQFYLPAQQALVPGMVGRAEGLTSANALISVNGAVTRLAGASLGGVVFATLGLPAAVAIDVGTYAAAAGCLLMLRWRPEPRRGTPCIPEPRRGTPCIPEPRRGTPCIPEPGRAALGRLRSVAPEFRAGLRHVSADGPLRGLLAAASVFWAGNGAFTALLVSYIHLRLHGTAADVGFLVTATGAGFLAGAPLGRALYHHLSLRSLTATSLLIAAAAFAGWFSVSELALALLLAALTGMSAMVFLIARLTCLQQCTCDQLIGRTCSIFFAVEGAAGLAGTAIGGLLVGLAGFTPVVGAAAATIALAAVIAALFATAASPGTCPLPAPAGTARAASGDGLRCRPSRLDRVQVRIFWTHRGGAVRGRNS